MQVRTARLDDARAIAAVDVASWQSAYRGIMPDAYLDALSVEQRTDDWLRRLGGRDVERGRHNFVTEGDGGVTGFIRIGPGPDDPSAGFVYLLYVLPTCWGTGAGSALMTAAAAALRGMGYPTATLAVLEANDRARRFYERRGWRTDGRREHDTYGGRELAVLRYTRSL